MFNSKFKIQNILYRSVLLSRRGELNPRPLPYQGSALPLSYSGLKVVSGRRSSNPRPLAWKANALPTELLPLISSVEITAFSILLYLLTAGIRLSGESRIRTYEGIRQQIYSLPQLTALVSPPLNRLNLSRDTFATPSGADEGIRTPDLQITNQLL